MNADIIIGVNANTTQAIQGLRQTGQEMRDVAQQAGQLNRRLAVSELPGPSRIAVGPKPYQGVQGLSEQDRQWDLMRHQFETAQNRNVAGFKYKSENRNTSTAEISALGKSIGIAAGGYLANSVVQTFSSVAGSFEGGNWEARRISQVGGGVVSGITTGAMMGASAGPLGVAAGAATGGIISGAASLIGVKSLEAYEGRQGLYDIQHQIQSQGRQQNTFRDDSAFQLTLETMTRDEQRAALVERVRQIRYGDGWNSIRKLSQRQQELALKGGQNTPDYMENAERLSAQLQRVDAMERQIFQLDARPASSLLEASEVGDNLGRIGGAVGAQIDVSEVNREQLQVLREIRDGMFERAEKSPDRDMGSNVYN